MKHSIMQTAKRNALLFCFILLCSATGYGQLANMCPVPTTTVFDCTPYVLDGARHMLPVAYVGRPYRTTLRIANPPAAPGDWSLILPATLPLGLAAGSLNVIGSASLLISFTPTTAGDFQFRLAQTSITPSEVRVLIRVLDPTANTTGFTIASPTANLSGTVGSNIGAAGNALFRGTAGSGVAANGEVTWVETTALLPPGLRVHSRSSMVNATPATTMTTHEMWISGTPTASAVGAATFQARVNDGTPLGSPVTLNLNIVSALSLTWDASNPATLPNRTRGGDPALDAYPVQPFSVTASDGVLTGYAWSLVQVSGPAMTAAHYIFDASGAATGIPTGNTADFQLVTTGAGALAAGTYTFRIQAARGSVTAQSGIYTVVISQELALSIGGWADPLRTLAVGDPFTSPGGFTMLASGGDNTYSWGFASPTGPENIPSSWLQVIPSMGNPAIGQLQQIGGQATTQGNFLFRIQVTNTTGGRIISNAGQPIHIVVNRKPIDMVIVLDRSGSMEWGACSTCSGGNWPYPANPAAVDCTPGTGGNRDSRWCRLFANLDALLQFLNDDFVGGQNITVQDRIGVVYFDDKVERYRSTNLLNFDGSIFTGLSSIPTQTNNRLPRGGTSIGGGILSAVNMLDLSTSANRCKYIILMTDGEQTSNPYVNEVSNNYIINGPIDLASGIINTPLGVPLTLNTLDLEIHTIGLASQVDLAQLLGIATATGGTSNIVNDMTGVHIANATMDQGLYNEMVGVLSACSPQFVSIRNRKLSGTQGDETFAINANVKKISFKLVGEAGENLNFQILKNGQPISGIGERTATGMYHKFLFVNFPTTDQNGNPVTPQGNWTMRVTGKSGASFAVSVIVEEKLLKQEYFLERPGGFYRAGDPLRLVANLSYAGVPVTNAKVTAEILAPGESLPTKVSSKPPVSVLKDVLTKRFAYTAATINNTYIAESNARFAAVTITDAVAGGLITVKGRVMDSQGAALIGAAIRVKGSTSGTVTDANGQFSIRAKTDDILVTAYTGFQTVETPINGLTNFDIILGDSGLKRVSGLVRNIITDEPLAGVLIQTKGSSKYSTRSKDDGSYSFAIPANETIVFSGAGLQSIETPVGAQGQRNMLLGPTGYMPSVVLGGTRYEANASIASIQKNQLWATGALGEFTTVSNKIVLTHTGNGHYQAPFTNTNITGDYKIVFTTEIDHPQAGRIDRMSMQDAVVRFGRLSLDASVFEVLERGFSDGYYHYDLHIKPADKFGNLIGIGQAQALQITSSNARVKFPGTFGSVQRLAAMPQRDSIIFEPAIDQLDGSYLIPFKTLAKDADFPVKVVIDQQEDTPLYNGQSNNIPEGNTGGGGSGILPIGTGIALPVGTFGDAFDPGFMIELKFGKPVSASMDRLYYNAQIGYYTFKGKILKNSINIIGGGLGLRYDLARFGTGDKWKFSIDGNAAYYKPSDQDGNFGLNAGLALMYDISNSLSLGLGAGYHHVFTDPGLDFLSLGLGIRINLPN